MRGRYQLDLLGAFRLLGPDQKRIQISSKRARILLAMLATSRSGERSRRWLQERIWGSRGRPHGQASLRREIANLRRVLSPAAPPLLIIEQESVALDLSQIDIDIRDPARVAHLRDEFLEGIDIAREEEFEDWLREERQAISTIRDKAGSAPGMAMALVSATGQFKRSITHESCGVAYYDDGLPAEKLLVLKRIASLAARLVERSYTRLSLSGRHPLAIAKHGSLAEDMGLLGPDFLLSFQLGVFDVVTVTVIDTREVKTLWCRAYDMKLAASIEGLVQNALADVEFPLPAFA